MAERFHDSAAYKVQTPLGTVKFTQRIKTHSADEVAAPDGTGGHISYNGATVINPSFGTFDDNLPQTQKEAEAISPGPGGRGHGRMLKDASSTLNHPTNPHDQYQTSKIANKSFSGRIRF